MNIKHHNNVLTIVAPTKGELENSLVDALTDHLFALGLNPSPPKWLSSSEACDIYYTATYPHEALEGISSILNSVKIDFHAQRTIFRKKKILVADMDSTIITSETIDELAIIAGCGPEVASITERSMKGELIFGAAVKERVAMLSGLSAKVIDKILKGIRLSKGAKTLVRTMATHGALTIMVSGGFKNFSDPVAKKVGFDQNYANRLEIIDGKLTGKVFNPILGPNAKKETLIAASSGYGASMLETLAIGDGANDIPMIKAAGLGIAYRGKPITRKASGNYSNKQSTGALIDYTNLTAALFFQGYMRKEFTK